MRPISRPAGPAANRPAGTARKRERRTAVDEIVTTREPEGAPAGARLAIVVDDLGNDSRALARILKIREPLTGAVLPHLPKSRETALALRGAGKEVLLHLPMEPIDPRQNPGPGLVRDAMSAEEIRTTVDSDLAEVPGADGVNNHMGSRGTADRRTVGALLQVLARHELFFLDSRTTIETRVVEEGLRTGVPVLSRDVFLDDEEDEGSIERQLASAEALARKTGTAIAIGHPHDPTLAVLERFLPRLREKGITPCRVSDLKSAPRP